MFKFVKDRWFVYMIVVSPCIFLFFSQFMAVCWMCEFITVNSQHIKFIHCTIKIFWQQLWRRKHFSEADFITNSSTYRKGVPTWTGWMFYFEMLLTHTYTSSQKWWLSHGLENLHKQNKMQVPYITQNLWKKTLRRKWEKKSYHKKSQSAIQQTSWAQGQETLKKLSWFLYRTCNLVLSSL